MTITSKSSLTFQKPKRSFKYRCLKLGINLWGKIIPDNAFNLSQNSLIEAAQKITGLDDFGDPSFRTSLAILIDSLKKEAHLNAAGQYLFRDILLNLLINRLQLQRDFQSYPEILQVPIKKPLFVLGLPRSGTTFLFNLLSQDPQCRWLHPWESLHPSPPPVIETAASDPRIKRVQQKFAFYKSLAPDIDTAHYIDVNEPDECNGLFENNFTTSLLFFSRANVPTYQKWLHTEADWNAAYQYYRAQLQLLSWKWPGEHWLLKTPAHLFHLDSLLTVFPDACIVQNHRDPIEAIPSLASLISIIRGVSSDDVEPAVVGQGCLDEIAIAINRAIKVRQNTSSKQFFDVKYQDLVQDPIDIVKQIYDYFDYNYSEQMEKNLQQYIKENRQYKHGIHRYSLEQFRLNADQVNETFQDYRQYF
ncbi:hypothetical protein NIES4071_06100 [Calothrix sp. NIES-4071]|nr:hypothetical protein NIES4071_06100 [Calothrix sp. NIES-4071]BAZ54953.1 hypothetical protein NIES4105_06070 [Calothrix sp. NIES-4105]